MVRFALLCMILLQSLLLAAPLAANPIRTTLIEIQAADLRVARIGYRLLTANAARCAKTVPGTGMVLHSLAQYSPAVRRDAIAVHGFLSPVSLSAVIPESPAERAGLRPGDGITAINGQPLNLTTPSPLATNADRDMTEQRFWSLPPNAPIRLIVTRQEGSRELTLVPSPACRVRIEVLTGGKVKAHSNGETIQVGLSFAARLNDEEIAFAIAHELAHVILEHRTKLEPFEGQAPTKEKKQERSRLARQFEDEADLLSLHLLSAAGWDPGIAPRFMRGKGRQFAGSSRVHRGATDRALLMETEISRMPKFVPTNRAP